MIRILTVGAAAALMLSACSQPAEEKSGEAETKPAVTETETETEVPEPQVPEGPTIGYDETWDMIEYWSGEYPSAFAVTQTGVTLLGHERPSKTGEPTVSCALPYQATYSPWNGTRIDADGLKFVTMTYPTQITLTEDVVLETFEGEKQVNLSLTAGETLIYKSYMSEGWFIAEYDGKEYELEESALPQNTEFAQGPADEQWVETACAGPDQTRVWFRYSDVVKEDGIEVYNYTAYGEAFDLGE